LDLKVSLGSCIRRVTFCMGRAGASRKSPNDVLGETLIKRRRRPISEFP